MANHTLPSLLKIEASCAICGAPSGYPECPHEAQSLHLALDQALERWSGMSMIKDWALHTSRTSILSTFSDLRTARLQTHTAYLQSLPCYTIYHRYSGNPPISPGQLNLLLSQIRNAEVAFQQGIDEDWRRCCLKYPEVLDYFLGLVEVRIPGEGDARVREPVFGDARVREPVFGGGQGRKRLEERRRRGSRDGRSRERERERRRGRTRTPPVPEVPRRR